MKRISEKCNTPIPRPCAWYTSHHTHNETKTVATQRPAMSVAQHPMSQDHCRPLLPSLSKLIMWNPAFPCEQWCIWWNTWTEVFIPFLPPFTGPYYASHSQSHRRASPRISLERRYWDAPRASRPSFARCACSRPYTMCRNIKVEYVVQSNRWCVSCDQYEFNMKWNWGVTDKLEGPQEDDIGSLTAKLPHVGQFMS